MDIKNSTLDDIAGVIGFTATLRLSAWFGGRGNLYVPDVLTDDHLLIKLIGRPCAVKLVQEWGKHHLAIPTLAGYADDCQRRSIGALLAAGRPTRYIAQEMQLTERRVQQICRELEMAGLIPAITPRKTPLGAGPGSEKWEQNCSGK